MDYWGEYPPVHLLARALIPAFGGVGASSAGAGEAAGHGGHSDAEMDAFFAALSGAAPMGPGFPAPEAARPAPGARVAG
jgi:hypothetical protein